MDFPRSSNYILLGFQTPSPGLGTDASPGELYGILPPPIQREDLMLMNSRALTTRTQRTSGQRRGRLIPLLAGSLILLNGFIGCSDEETPPNYPTRPEPQPPVWLYSVWGSGPDDVFIVGQPGIIRHWNGSSWQVQAAPTQERLTAVWGRSANEVYACGHKGVILRYNGSSWSTMNSGTNQNLFAIGSYQGTIHCAGQKGELRKLSSGSWVNTSTFIVRRNPAGTAVIDTLERDREISSLTTITEHGIGGSDGIVLMQDIQYDWRARTVAAGLEWVQSGHSNTENVEGNYLTTSGGRIFRLRAGSDQSLSWLELSGLVPERTAINGIWADVGDTLYLATRDGDVYRRNPLGDITLTHEGSLMLYDIWGTAPDNIYAVGIQGTVIHWDGAQWEALDIGLPSAKNSETEWHDKFGRIGY